MGKLGIEARDEIKWRSKDNTMKTMLHPQGKHLASFQNILTYFSHDKYALAFNTSYFVITQDIWIIYSNLLPDTAVRIQGHSRPDLKVT